MYVKKLHVAMTKKNWPIPLEYFYLSWYVYKEKSPKRFPTQVPDVDEMTQRNGILTKSNFPNIYMIRFD